MRFFDCCSPLLQENSVMGHWFEIYYAQLSGDVFLVESKILTQGKKVLKPANNIKIIFIAPIDCDLILQRFIIVAENR